MRRLLVYVLCAATLVTSCIDNQIDLVLTSAEMSLSDNPKSSLEVLELLDNHTLKTREQKARYALLYSKEKDSYAIIIRPEYMRMLEIIRVHYFRR